MILRSRSAATLGDFGDMALATSSRSHSRLWIMQVAQGLDHLVAVAGDGHHPAAAMSHLDDDLADHRYTARVIRPSGL